VRTNLFDEGQQGFVKRIPWLLATLQFTETLSKVAVARVEVLLLHTTSPMYTL
jgi:hypothetical protein